MEIILTILIFGGAIYLINSSMEKDQISSNLTSSFQKEIHRFCKDFGYTNSFFPHNYQKKDLNCVFFVKFKDGSKSVRFGFNRDFVKSDAYVNGKSMKQNTFDYIKIKLDRDEEVDRYDFDYVNSSYSLPNKDPLS